MEELWLLRHGATAWAREGRHTGRTDRPLLPEGEAEARRAGTLRRRGTALPARDRAGPAAGRWGCDATCRLRGPRPYPAEPGGN
ncbi:MAG: phosphoglycerate mutase family protein, partial [Synechococcaceae cyanobacterium]|nr:phosphoglycerate mutase family protein [Synechococcaceae cyanobacterium]